MCHAVQGPRGRTEPAHKKGRRGRATHTLQASRGRTGHMPLTSRKPPVRASGALRTCYITHAKYRALKRRIDMLESAVCSLRRV
jgi:hypothetical protein